MDLPDDLQAALSTALETVPVRRVSRATYDLSERYRAGHARSPERFLRSDEDILAYAAFRLPATYASVHAALTQVRLRRPGWRPRTLLDVGAGPGTATWAAAAVWPELEAARLLERDERMIGLGRKLAAGATSAVVREAKWRRTDVGRGWDLDSYDLVVAAYLLGEAPQSDGVVDRLWSSSADTLVLVEPGTPRGYFLVLAARDQLLGMGARTLAPCPHDRFCPLGEDDWCHFAQRIARTPLHRSVKRGSLSYEDEKFSYVALSRTAGLPIAARVIRHPQSRPGHIYLDLCTPAGIERTVVTRSMKSEFRQARDLRWGSAIPADGAE